MHHSMSGHEAIQPMRKAVGIYGRRSLYEESRRTHPADDFGGKRGARKQRD